MPKELRFDGRVAIVTGAGAGLGRAHALLLASRGAAVVVNDLGGDIHGGGQSGTPAQKVVDEIKAAGGEAVANFDSVENGDKIVQTALDTYKRIDIVINNAGILRDVSFHKMTDDDWDIIYRVHVLGTYKVTHAAWPHLREQQFGRVVMTASAAGIYGNFGQANYSMAKLGIAGFANTLAREGHTKNVHVNTIAPVAGSRLTETVLPEEMIKALKPEYVSPLVAWLCHDDCPENGGLFEVGAGWFTKLRWERTKGLTLPLNREIKPEMVQEGWNKIIDWAGADHPGDVQESMGPAIANLATASKPKAGNEFVDPEKVLSFEFKPEVREFDESDVTLYALGIGCARNPLDPKELQYVYELSGDGHRTFPTFAVTLPSGVLPQIIEMPGLKFNPMMLLHGEQYLEIKRPIPTEGTATTTGRVKHLYDKGKGAVLVIESLSKDANGNELCVNESTIFIRGIGGFGGDRGPTARQNEPPDRAPDAVIEERTDDNQALLYRLAGDRNPLHADPAMAAVGGFDKPILHGLCSFGFAARHVLKQFGDNDPERFKSIKVRFAKHVFPGETLVTEMWKESDTRVVFRVKVKERNETVITDSAVELNAATQNAKKETPAAATATASASNAASAAPSSNGGNGTTVKSIFDAMDKRIAEKPELVGKIGAVYRFDVKGEGGGTWAVDLKNGQGSVKSGAPANADCTITMNAEDFVGLMTGELDGQQAFMSGKLKVSGNMMLATKLNMLQ